MPPTGTYHYILSQVVSKIIKHSREAQGANAHGLLLGLDLDGTLEVSNSFPLPHHFNDDDDKSVKGVGMSCIILSLRSCLIELSKRNTRLPCYARSRKYRQTTASSDSTKQPRLAPSSAKLLSRPRPSIKTDCDTEVLWLFMVCIMFSARSAPCPQIANLL